MNKKIEAFWLNWSQFWKESGGYRPKDLPVDKITSVAFAFVPFGIKMNSSESGWDVTNDFKLYPMYTQKGWGYNDIEAMEDLELVKQQNLNLKTVFSVGGWNFNSPDDPPIGSKTSTFFSTMVSDVNHRKEFIDSAMDFAEGKFNGGSGNWTFDGIDIDWEYPGSPSRGGQKDDFTNLLQFFKEFRDEINARKIQMTISFDVGAFLSPDITTISQEDYEKWVAECAVYVDEVSVMTYDFRTSLSGLGTQANAPTKSYTVPAPDTSRSQPLSFESSLSSYAKAFTNKGVALSKIIPGFAFYGRSYSNVQTWGDRKLSDMGLNSNGAGPMGPDSGQPGVLNYNEIIQLSTSSGGGWNQLTLDQNDDSETAVAYSKMTTGSDYNWISYDDETSIKAKTDIVNKLGLGGAMLFSPVQDQHDNSYPLTTAVYNGLNNQPNDFS